MAYTQITLTLIVDEDDAASVLRELQNNLDFLTEEYVVHQDRLEDEATDYDPEDDEYKDLNEDLMGSDY